MPLTLACLMSGGWLWPAKKGRLHEGPAFCPVFGAVGKPVLPTGMEEEANIGPPSFIIISSWWPPSHNISLNHLSHFYQGVFVYGSASSLMSHQGDMDTLVGDGRIGVLFGWSKRLGFLWAQLKGVKPTNKLYSVRKEIRG